MCVLKTANASGVSSEGKTSSVSYVILDASGRFSESRHEDFPSRDTMKKKWTHIKIEDNVFVVAYGSEKTRDGSILERQGKKQRFLLKANEKGKKRNLFIEESLYLPDPKIIESTAFNDFYEAARSVSRQEAESIILEAALKDSRVYSEIRAMINKDPNALSKLSADKLRLLLLSSS